MLIILSIIKRPIIFLVMYDIIRSIACESLFCCNCDTQITVYEWKCCEVHMQTCMYIIICYCHGWFSLYSHNCGHIDICDSLLQVLPRLHENLTLLHLHTQAIVMSDECVLWIALLLKKTAVVIYSPVMCSYYSQTYLFYYDRSLATLMFTVMLDNVKPAQLLVSGVTDCDAAEILMRHNSVKKLVLHVDTSCRRALADIKYSRDREIKIEFVDYQHNYVEF